MSIAAGNGRINVRRNVTAGSLLSVSGAPKRRASTLLFMNANAAEQTAVFSGDDAVDVTVTVPLQSSIELCGDFETLGALGTDVTVIAGWVDDGAVQRNA